nr:hypothetical protein [Tanacetum cinerariifolium]
MVAYLTKSDVIEGFTQIIDFINGSYIKYALTVSPNIYMSCIKQFCTTVAIKQVNDVTRLQALVNKKKVVVTEAAIRELLHLDDAEGVDCLPNEEIFTELARMGYEKPSTKLTFYKAFFSRQEIEEEGDADEHVKDVTAGDDAHGDDTAAHGEFPTKVRTSQRVDTFDDTVMDDESNPGRMIAEMDKDVVVVLMNDKEDDKKVEETKVVESVQEDETEPAKVEEVVDVVTTAKLITKVVTAASETVIAASAICPTAEPQVLAAILTAAPARVAATPKEPKPLKKKQQIEMDEEYARKLHAELNKDIDWDVAIDHVKLKAKEDPAVKRYQAMKRKPQTETQARKNMMMYLKNVVGFKLDYFKGIFYDDICPIFKAKFNSNVHFLINTKEQMEEEENRALQTINETPAEKAAKRRKLNEEVEDLKRHLKIVCWVKFVINPYNLSTASFWSCCC